MEVSETTVTETETRRVVEVNGHEFYVDELAGPLGQVCFSPASADRVDSRIMRKMQDAGLVTYDDGSRFRQQDTDPQWKDKDGKCYELFQELNDPYKKIRVKVKSYQQFEMFDESEEPDAREKAEAAKARLEERNPDVEFILDEEELDRIPGA